MYGYGILNNHVPTLKATVMKGGAALSPLLTGLFAVYKAESNANDSLGLNNATAVGGLTYIAGKSGNGFKFNGTNAQVLIGDGAMNKNTFTYAFWVKMPTTSVGYGIIFSNFTNITNQYYYGIRMTAYQTSFGFAGFQGVGTSFSITGGTIDTSKYQLVLVEHTTTSHKLWVDNVNVATDTQNITIAYESDNKPSIGIEQRTRGTIYNYPIDTNTIIDESYFYDRILTTQEKTDLYNAGAGKFYPTF
jgi:hypothetical protein